MTSSTIGKNLKRSILHTWAWSNMISKMFKIGKPQRWILYLSIKSRPHSCYISMLVKTLNINKPPQSVSLCKFMYVCAMCVWVCVCLCLCDSWEMFSEIRSILKSYITSWIPMGGGLCTSTLRCRFGHFQSCNWIHVLATDYLSKSMHISLRNF